MCQQRVSGRIAFEGLESRRMMAAVSVKDFGAVANDGQDDAPAIRAAIGASDAGDTIKFGSGAFNIGSSIELLGDRTYRGKSDTTLLGGRDYHIFQIHQDHTTVQRMTLDGKPIFIDHNGNVMVANLLIDEVIFHVHASGDGRNGITFTTGLRDSSITDCTFDPIDGDNGIYGYNWDNLAIANNAFIDGNEGIHITAFNVNCADLLIEQNYLSGLHRMGVEIQGGGVNTIVQDNYYENPSMTSNANDNRETFAYSIIADQARDTIIRRNTVIAPERLDGKGVRILFEIGGDNTLVEENYTVGGNHTLSENDFSGTTSAHARNNLFTNFLQAASGRNLTQENNGASATLSWNINRGKPGPNQRVDLDGYVTDEETPPPPPPSDPIPKPTPADDEASKYVYLSDMDWNAARNDWGPVERDQFNGGSDLNDGRAISMGGKTYKKGLGVAADSQVAYKLNGRYSKLKVDIGLDDYADSRGSVTFQVFVDGKKVYDSGLMTRDNSPKKLSIKLNGAKWLRLVTTDGGDGGKSDHADWADARLLPRD